MKTSIDVFFFIDEEMPGAGNINLSGKELKEIIEERSGKIVSLNVCRCTSSGDFLNSLEENLSRSIGEAKQGIYVLWGRDPDALISGSENLKKLMEKGRKELGLSFVFMGNTSACNKLSQKTGLKELTNIRHSSDSYGVRGALRCFADIVGKLNANPA